MVRAPARAPINGGDDVIGPCLGQKSTDDVVLSIEDSAIAQRLQPVSPHARHSNHEKSQ
jgi:hypothetical protein